MNICIVTYMYPGKHNTSDFVFVKNIVDEFARQGHQCMVVCPFNCLHYRQLFRGEDVYLIDDKIPVTVLRPNYISASTLHFGKFNLSDWLHKIAVSKALNKMWESGFHPDAIYCHFWNSCIEAYSFSHKHDIPLFVATGESDNWMESMNRPPQEVLDYIKGVICVSSSNKMIAERRMFCTSDKNQVFPNSVNGLLFRKLDKELCRKKLNLPLDKYIISYVGWFDERKGSKRVSEAIAEINDNDVYSLFIGNGNDVPNCNNILFLGKVPHENLPEYLNASDVFVLPTQHEGCCNAVIEAIACGLPIISSNLPFNWDVLDNTNSIMIDPNSIEDIKNAIVVLRDNLELREILSQGALNKAQQLTIDKRAMNIINFMQTRML